MALWPVKDFTGPKVKVGFLQCMVAVSAADGSFVFPLMSHRWWVAYLFFSSRFHIPHFARRLPASNVASHVLQQKGWVSFGAAQGDCKGHCLSWWSSALGLNLLWIFDLVSFFSLPLGWVTDCQVLLSRRHDRLDGHQHVRNTPPFYQRWLASYKLSF